MNESDKKKIEDKQKSANEKRKQIISALNKEDQHKFHVVEEVVDILVKHDIPFFLFPFLKYYKNYDNLVAWQWNNIVERFGEFNEDGNPTEESFFKVQDCYKNLNYTLLNQILMRDISLRFNIKNPADLPTEELCMKLGQLLLSDANHVYKSLPQEEV